MTVADALAAAAVVVLAGGACLVLVADLVRPLGPGVATAVGAAVAVAAGIAAGAVGMGDPGFAGALARDGAAIAFTIVIAATTAASLLLAPRYLAREDVPASEFVALVLLSAAGAALMAAGRDLVIIFLGLELLSLPLYALTALLRRAPHGDEGALKYFLLGAAASAVLVYGIALLYAATGHVDLAGLGAAGGNALYLAGAALVVAGLAFKAALVPFHSWAPDAYDSAPTPATAYMAVVAKVGAFAALLRIVSATSGGDGALDWRVSLAALAAATIVLANLLALAQRRVKRLLAYSSIAHAGYIGIGAAAGALAGPVVLFYLAVYAALTIGSFGVIALLDNDDPTLSDLGGLWRRKPLLVAVFGLVLFGLVGLPPTGGFVAKLYVFEAAIRAQLLWLVVLAVLASVVSAAYYVRVLLACFEPGDGRAGITPSPRLGVAVVTAAGLAVIVLGTVPGPLLDLAQRVTY